MKTKLKILKLVKKELLTKKDDGEEEEEETLTSKIVETMCYPVEIMLMTTCLPAEKEEFESSVCQVSVIGGTIFVFWVFNQSGFFDP